MNRPGYEYTVPASTAYYASNNRPPQYERGYAQLATNPLYSPSSHPPSNYADIYEGNNDTTLRAEERNWYIENHKTIQTNPDHHESLPHDAKIQKQDEKKEAPIRRSDSSQARQRRKEDRCSCECWPSTDNNVVQDSTGNETSRSLSGVDMVASYGVYGNSQDDDSSGFARVSEKSVYGQVSDVPVQGVIVNQQGNSSVVRSTNVSESPYVNCCTFSSNASASHTEDYCWIHYCRPALIVLLLLFFLILLGVAIGFLLTNNYLHYQPRPPVPEEACEKTFCRWGAECVSLGDGRAHCACPTSCPSTSTPICSTAGRTYRNHCYLRKEACERRLNLRVKHEGECEAGDPCAGVTCPLGARCVAAFGQAECRCPRSCQRKKPVCGSDGREYPSICHLEKHGCDNQVNITVKYHGKCDPCAEYECADGGICQLNEVRAPVCRCGPLCDLVVRPGSAVCGSDYRDYPSECSLRRESCRTREQLTIAYRGDCASAQHPCESVKCGVSERCSLDARGVAVCGCGAECEAIVRPVCGTNGQSYDSPCHLDRAACRNNRDIRVAYMGLCGEENPCARATCPWGGACVSRGGAAQCACPVCDASLSPVCASDHNTYGSECKMRMHACQESIKEGDLRVLYNSTCQTCVDIVCHGGGACALDEETGRPTCSCHHNCTETQEPNAVCGSDGQTYSSQCKLESTACRAQKDIRVAYKGSCALCEGVQCTFGAHCAAGECICPTDCSGATRDPVCGSTMQTFTNECELQKAACQLVPPSSLHVIFYGDCKDRLAVVPPIAMTTTSMTSTEVELMETGESGWTDLDGTADPTACQDIRCDFGASCEIGVDGYPRCSCLFECPIDEEYFPVCASDFRLYSSLCAMRKEGCQKQLELRLRPLDLCKGMEVRPCGNNKAMIDVATGLEIDCGNGPHRKDCPMGSYCHITLTAAKCCPKDDTKLQIEEKKINHCSESEYGCCSDGATAAASPNEEGCPITSSTCGCNRLGSVSDRCDEAGQCSCRPGVGGLKCDRCEPGYWGLPQIGSGHAGCIPCGCSAFGSVREDCEQMTGRCVCRSGVQGQKCTLCTDHQRRLGPNGCSDPERNGAAQSCSELSCYFGAVCTERTGGALCECAAAPCPDSDRHMLVCGSDGKTYDSECHLKLQACRTQDDIVVQAFGPCKLSEIPGTAGPPRPSVPIQFTQQDDGTASKSTRHLLNPTYNKYDWTRKETPSDFDSIFSGQKSKGSQTATTATVGAVGALLGDLCAEDSDCVALPGAHCAHGGCVCRPGYVPDLHRKACIDQIDQVTTEEYSACLSEPCYNLGTCVDLPGSTYTCVCTTLYAGSNCETLVKDSLTTTSIETPSFDGSSYIRLKPLKAYHKLNIDIEFKAFSENGVLLYNQQKTDGTGDFVSLALVNGYLEFRYNLGNGALVLTSLEKITLNEYHKVSAKRYHRDGILSVDDMEDVAGQSGGHLKALDLAEDTYIGSVPSNYSRIFDNIGTRSGFIGCVKYLRIIRHLVTKKLGRPDPLIVSLENIRECQSNPCIRMPCKNGGKCKPIERSTTEFICDCPIGYQGANCDVRLDPCESNPCGYDEGLLCDIGPDGGHVCRCLYGGEIGSSGNTCNNDVNVVQETWTPQFNGSSYVELPPLEGLGKAFRIEIWFMTNRLSGMLFYTGQSNKAKGDFIAINLVNGYLQFRYNLGSGVANITSPVPITKGRWHRTQLTRIGRHGSLQLDHYPVQKGSSAPPLTHMDVKLPFFFGSLPSYIRPHKWSAITSSFIGAIQQVFVNGNQLPLYSADTAKCSVVQDEDQLPCATSGVTKYTGPPCGDDLTPCKNNGSCVPLLNEYKCICRDGFQGRNCEVQLKVEMLNDRVPLKFDGNSYYSYRSRGGRRKRNDRGIRYEIKFRTYNDSGLLMWRRKIGIRPRDFIGLGLSEGKLQLIYTDTDVNEINSATHEDWFQSIESKARVDDGLWHTATVRRRKRLAMLQVDDTSPVRGYSQSLLVPSKSNPKLWLGGSPSLPLGLPAALYTGFRGCVASVKACGRHIDLASPIRPVTPVKSCD